MAEPELTEEAKKGMIDHAVKPNYYALCICVLSERIPEEAFRVMGLTSEKFNASDVDELLRLKKTHTWKQLGERYGISADAVRRRIIRSQERRIIS